MPPPRKSSSRPETPNIASAAMRDETATTRLPYRRYYAAMSWLSFSSRQASTPSLEADAAYAGLALACPFSSSAEFDAALIAERRAAGVYGPRRHRTQNLTALAGVAAGLAVLLLLTL